MKLSDYVFEYLKEKGVKNVFMLPGGGAMHLVDSLGNSGLEFIACQHEQAASIMAEAYGQHTNTPGVCLTTSGPGATNAITGVTAGWIDSTPMFIISGQAKRSDLIGETGVRQIGSQEVQIIDMVKPITKYAIQIMDASEIRYVMGKAYHEATTGRPGPVWISIPLDVQAAEIEPEKLKGFESDSTKKADISKEVEKTFEVLINSHKPMFLAGNGIKLSGATEEFYKLTDLLEIPVETTWKTIDMFGEEDSCYMGHPGGMGDRGANWVLQEADVLISVGSRIDTSLTAFNEANFGKNAKKVIVDIDANELNRMKLQQVEAKISCDAKLFIEGLTKKIEQYKSDNNSDFEEKKIEWKKWLNYGKELRKAYPSVTQLHREKKDYVSAYYFTELLCKYTSKDDVIVPESSGAAGGITYQAFSPKRGQKMKNAAGLGSMGFGLPYSIGSCLANDKRRTILINGDGAFQLNIQELETLVRLNLPIKIFIWNNGGYASIRGMQNNNFAGHQVASGKESGLSMPNISKVAGAYGIKTTQIRNNSELEEKIPKILKTCNNELELIEIFIAEDDIVSPRTKSFRRSDGTMESSKLEDMWPRVER
ncbi:MAG: thiamine pyrophosphate-binding protein [Lachnospiraceae bacterium]|nr:thiamine pyrophosphate-binding protein [Lachnospiraceae bacterium]